MDPFDDIRVFQRVAELGSLRSVAREAGVEPSSISRRMNRLEARLGSKLLERAQNRTRLTEAGEDYYARMRILLPQLEAAEAAVAGEADEPKGLLKVNASIEFGQRHVANWLLTFQERFPKVDVELTLSSHHVDLVADGVDVAIRVGHLRDSSLVARRLAAVPRVLVASPEYLESYGVPEHPADLVGHRHVFYSAGNRHQPLLLNGPDGQQYRIERQGHVTINSVSSIVAAVERGHGIHIGPRWAFQEALDKRTVVVVLPDYSQEPMPMSAVWAPAALQPARIRTFVQHCANQVKAIPGLVV